jgi:hypothetical protein
VTKNRDEYDFDVTVVEDEYWDDVETKELPRQRVTTSVQSPIELSLLLEICKAEK